MVDGLSAGEQRVRDAIVGGDTALGIELGSTRIKAALIGPDRRPIATGSHAWSNQLVDGRWTYDLADVIEGLQSCYADLAHDVLSRYGVRLTTVGALGCSAMMHGYLALDDEGDLLVPFRTWRNTNTDRASRALTELFAQNIPHRWSIAHLYQAILDDEEHVPRLAHLTTLAGYVHWRLTGRRVLGVGDASGMFPIDVSTGTFDTTLAAQFDELVAGQALRRPLSDVLPTVLTAGEASGTLTDDGAVLLDPSRTLMPGVPLCPPEGDAGTGMVATNSVRVGTGNVSAGTSIFAMVVLEHPLRSVHPEIDIVTTPAGDLVGMVHCNNGTSELDAWIAVFGEFARSLGSPLEGDDLFERMYRVGLAGDSDAGGLLAYNFVAGEPIVNLDEGRPLVVRQSGSRFTLANFVRAQLYATVGTLRIGMDVLADEGIRARRLLAHGGFVKTEGVGQGVLAAALDTPVSVGAIAGEGGAWGMALLAAYSRGRSADLTLTDFLTDDVFVDETFETITPTASEVDGFNAYMDRFRRGLPIARQAVEDA